MSDTPQIFLPIRGMLIASRTCDSGYIKKSDYDQLERDISAERERCAELENRPHDEVLLNDMNLMAKSYAELMRVAEGMFHMVCNHAPQLRLATEMQAFDALKQKAGE